MNREIAVLFDMDGVVVDTEPQYDIFWKSIGEKYLPEVEDLEKKIKGTVNQDIYTNYFSHFSEYELQQLARQVEEYELNMDFFEIPGAMDFIRSLKQQGIKTGLVTSSSEAKVKKVGKALGFGGLFDTIVAAERIKEGKPHPMCYLLAAQDLEMHPADCYVFEDSFAGIQAGNNAGMKVIGLSTTHPAESLQGKVIQVIPDFRGFQLSMVNSSSIV